MTTLTSDLTGTIGEAMHVGLVCCSRETPLRVVAARMAQHRVHCILVVDYGDDADADHQLVGLVSDRDLARAYHEGRFDGATAADVMESPPPLAEPGGDLRVAAGRLADRTPHLVVGDAISGRPVGVLSTLDLARWLATEPDPVSR